MENSTHQLIDVEDIKDNILIVKGGHMRMILMVSSLNFALKSEDEQQALVERFQDFLNSMSYTVEIVIQSRQLDISEYLLFLNEQAEKQTNELLKIQTAEYAGFIQELIKLSNIMSKFFYVVVTLNKAPVNIKSGFFKRFLSGETAPKEEAGKTNTDLDFESRKNELMLRVEQAITLLGAMGVKAIPLGREELIELLYTSYNPGAVLKQKNLEQLIATGDEAKRVE